MKTDISIIIPVYNKDKYIARCLRSVLNQFISEISYEIIIINDGSTDLSQYSIDQFKNKFDNRIKIINNKYNSGLPYSLNIGIKASQSEYIVRVDADDYVSKHFLNFLYIYKLANTDYDAISSDYLLVNESEEVISKCNCEENPIGCGILFIRENLIDIGLYNESYLRNEEKDLRLRYDKKYKIKRLDIPLYRYRKHDSNMTNNKKLMDYYDIKLKENNDI